ncbi:XTP/dITP diphosphohydrolase [Curtobacterium flaccumfaciens]|uniref:XTP/dITP diphosphohydrolase n=1 Tax=Curtobacterium salicis TaxID=1779862 RepID=A0ABX0T6G3_9MICO|nr:MazG family protein [Curtobacterium sp. WW7]NII40632.1 XTP/dITP diphosphohydrolase [Curtobacterium sp. WW7]
MTSVDELVAVVDRLLDAEHGCVWNREQTHASLARYAVEETYELVDAIDGDDTDELREELGDVLYQVVLHAGIAAHEGRFDLDDVADAVREKMQRRHPHVFGDQEAHTVEDVVRVWRAAKAAEKAGRSSVYAGVPRAMPPLERAVKLFERLEERGDLHAAVASVTDGSVVEQVGMLDGAAAPAEGAAVQQPFGSRVDVAWGAGMLAEVAVVHEQGIDPVASLRAAVTLLEAAARQAEQVPDGQVPGALVPDTQVPGAQAPAAEATPELPQAPAAEATPGSPQGDEERASS